MQTGDGRFQKSFIWIPGRIISLIPLRFQFQSKISDSNSGCRVKLSIVWQSDSLITPYMDTHTRPNWNHFRNQFWFQYQNHALLLQTETKHMSVSGPDVISDQRCNFHFDLWPPKCYAKWPISQRNRVLSGDLTHFSGDLKQNRWCRWLQVTTEDM